MFYEVIGEGPPLLFLHGFLEDSTMWKDLYGSFTDHQKIYIDLPGHGKSPVYDLSEYSMSFMAQSVVSILNKLEIDEPIVIGHSMGGYVGLELLKIYKLRKLVLFNSNFWADEEERVQNRNRVIQVVQKNKQLFLREAIANLFFVRNNKIDQIIDQLVSKAQMMNKEEIIKTTIGLRDRLEHKQTVEEFHSIVHIIQAENDPIIPLKRMQENLQTCTKKPEFYLIQNSGHMSVWENLKATKRILTEIVSKV